MTTDDEFALYIFNDGELVGIGCTAIEVVRVTIK